MDAAIWEGERHYRAEARAQHDDRVHPDGALVAANLISPTGTTVLIGREDAAVAFAVDVPGDGGRPTRRLSLGRDQNCAVTGAVVTSGLELGGQGPVSFGERPSPPSGSEPWHWYRLKGGEEGDDKAPPHPEWRIELPTPLAEGVLDPNQISVRTVASGGARTPVLTVNAGGVTTVHGSLKVHGMIVLNSPPGTAPPENALQVTVQPEQSEKNKLTVTVTITNTGPLPVPRASIVVTVVPSNNIQATKAQLFQTKPNLPPRGTAVAKEDVQVSATGPARVVANVLGVLPTRQLCHGCGVAEWQLKDNA
ncbi:hypothetical protein [Streptoalloteichus tenebrarius]|uniref:hypothetical protein n=1 Tax=Streptoalloteichus tenebrarius (strain ATCC 17920 / DSM 40477 / JCM 4838 / CBS 697.72 / NBRC 16177 / NCIMB 11028 / NRRL B-12390 / A12253. 1 / ISP 5477) TaxID=1933 RepID=UPI0020A4F113|nr:hypothetical protein [Streptoalloteichus tenebrarius]BFE98803.1 hypothetical protein GCM10020241_04790 [Streptoalloteichus tenebrarius]